MDSDSVSSSNSSESSRELSLTGDSQSEYEIVVTEETKQQFSKGFKKRPNVHDLMRWKQNHNDMVCKNCLLRGQVCTPKDNSAVCINCEEQRVRCSRALQEKKTRMRRLLNLSYPELDFLVDWYEKRKIKRSLVRRPPITPSSKKTKFQDTPTLSPEIQAKTARACRYEPEEDQYASSQTLSSSLVYEHDPMDHATATNFQEMWNEYMNDHRSASPQTPSREDGAGLDFVTLEHTDTVGDLEMANHEGPETSAERADVFFDGTVASTEGAAENLAALTYIELLLHKREVENITESVRIGNITQSQLVKALEAVSDGLYGLAMKYDVGFESGQASLVGGPEQQTD